LDEIRWSFPIPGGKEPGGAGCGTPPEGGFQSAKKKNKFSWLGEK